MAIIGATTALYKVETALTKANTEVSKSMSVTGRANANAGIDLLMLLWETHSALITLEQSQL